MKIVYNSDQFEVRKYGTEATYMVVDKTTKDFAVFEPPQSDALIEALQDGDGTELTDIYLDGVMVLARHYGEVG